MGLGDPGGAKCTRTSTASAAGVMALSESFLKPLAAGDQKASLTSLSPLAPLIQALRGLPCLGSSSVVWCLWRLKQHPGWGPTLLFWGQALDEPASLLFSC